MTKMLIAWCLMMLATVLLGMGLMIQKPLYAHTGFLIGAMFAWAASWAFMGIGLFEP